MSRAEFTQAVVFGLLAAALVLLFILFAPVDLPRVEPIADEVGVAPETSR